MQLHLLVRTAIILIATYIPHTTAATEVDSCGMKALWNIVNTQRDLTNSWAFPSRSAAYDLFTRPTPNAGWLAWARELLNTTGLTCGATMPTAPSTTSGLLDTLAMPARAIRTLVAGDYGMLNQLANVAKNYDPQGHAYSWFGKDHPNKQAVVEALRTVIPQHDNEFSYRKITGGWLPWSWETTSQQFEQNFKNNPEACKRAWHAAKNARYTFLKTAFEKGTYCPGNNNETNQVYQLADRIFGSQADFETSGRALGISWFERRLPQTQFLGWWRYIFQPAEHTWYMKAGMAAGLGALGYYGTRKLTNFFYKAFNGIDAPPAIKNIAGYAGLSAVTLVWCFIYWSQLSWLGPIVQTP